MQVSANRHVAESLSIARDGRPPQDREEPPRNQGGTPFASRTSVRVLCLSTFLCAALGCVGVAGGGEDRADASETEGVPPDSSADRDTAEDLDAKAIDDSGAEVAEVAVDAAPEVAVDAAPEVAVDAATDAFVKLPLPDMSKVVKDIGATHPDLVARSCQTDGGTWELMDLIVDTLRKTDTRWGYNWKRGKVGDPSLDVVDYHWGAGPAEGSTDVYIIDVVTGHCGPAPKTGWIDVTESTAAGGTIGRWTGRGRF